MSRVDYSALKDRYTRDGELRFTNQMIELINEGKINGDNFSLKGLWEAMNRPALGHKNLIGKQLTEAELKEEMDSTAFPKITGALINKEIQKAYELFPAVGDMLVTALPSSLKEETIVGFTSADTLQEVFEGGDYQEGAYGEKYHLIRNRKFGRILALTEEMIKFDQTGQMVMRARDIGQNARAKKEEIILDAVLETASTGAYASWRPAGTATTLYSNTSNDPYTSGTLDTLITDTLADETDIDAALAEFASMTDESGNPIWINPDILLTGLSYASIAEKIVGSQGSNINQKSSAVINPFAGKFKAVATSYVDSKKGAAYWLLGDFKRQFVYTEVFPVETFQAKPGNKDEFDRDILYKFKTRLMGGCGAITNRYVIQSTGGG